jgi:hypothetical protein
MSPNHLWILFTLLIISIVSLADKEIEIPQGKIKFGLNYFGTHKSEVENPTFLTSDYRPSFQMSAPVYTTIGDSKNSKKERWSLDYKLTQHNLNTDLLKDSAAILAQQFLDFDKWIAESKEFYALNIGGLNQKENTSRDRKTYAQITFLGTYHRDLDWVYIYGLYYGSEIDGQFLLLPLLGLKTQLSTDWDFLAILPLNLRFSRLMNRAAKLSFYIRPDSFRYDVSNEGRYVQSSQTLTIQLQRCRTEAQWSQYLSWQLLIEGKFSFVGKQKVKILDGEQEYASVSSNGTTYLGVNLQFQI